LEKIDLIVPIENIENILGTVTSPSIVLSEIIKNSVDSNAKNIVIKIFTNSENQIVINDDGDGLTLSDIKKLGLISESNKKTNGNYLRKDGYFFAGSKGLGILSLFSISDQLIIETENNNKRYKIIWSKGNSSFNYEVITAKNKNGTKIIISNINKEYLAILTDETELNKLKHLSIKNYLNSSLNSIKIPFYINNILCNELIVTHFSNLQNKFIATVKFNYDAKSNLLYFQYISNNNIINDNQILIDLSKEINISDILTKNYHISQVMYKGEPCKYLDFSLESFGGEISVTEKRRDDELLNFGPGIRVFVNQFAMYGYLDRENDWLNFSVYSLLRKNTRYKPHNVFGYTHFENLNENESNLKISNERAYFIENGAFKKFQEIMKNIITTLAFNIDVAEKNNLFLNEVNDSLRGEHTKTHSKRDVGETSSPVSNVEKIQSNTYSGVNNALFTPEADITNSNLDNTPPQSSNKVTDSKLVNKPKTIIKIEKKPKFNFFNTSNIIKFPEKIEIEYDELIFQLRKLEYKNFYLIYVIAFRSILEDISKKYLNTREIPLCGDFGQNIRLMTDDILKIIKDKNFITSQDKSKLENILGGYNSFKNFFETTGCDFYDKGKQGNKAAKLNSFVHTPRWMEIEEAENMANNIILPLYIISKEVLNMIRK
jgi:hypothetical protein